MPPRCCAPPTDRSARANLSSRSVRDTAIRPSRCLSRSVRFNLNTPEPLSQSALSELITWSGRVRPIHPTRLVRVDPSESNSPSRSVRARCARCPWRLEAHSDGRPPSRSDLRVDPISESIRFERDAQRPDRGRTESTIHPSRLV